MQFVIFSEKILSNANEFPLLRIWTCLGDVFVMLMTFDKIISSHPILTNHWKLFFETVQLIQHNPHDIKDNYLFLVNKLKPFFGLIIQFNHQIMGSKILQVVFFISFITFYIV